jgi:hypothetical protein
MIDDCLLALNEVTLGVCYTAAHEHFGFVY